MGSEPKILLDEAKSTIYDIKEQAHVAVGRKNVRHGAESLAGNTL